MRTLVAAVVVLLFTFETTLSQNTERRRRLQPPQFESVFTIRGVEFTAEQQLKVKQLREKSLPQLRKLQQELASVFTAEQRRARQEAITGARKADRDNRQIRKAADDAANISDEQRQQIAAIQQARTQLVAGIQPELQSLLTAAQKSQLQRQANQNRPRGAAPTHPNVKYGPHERNVMDVWLATSKTPTPVLVSIHGGGFRGGNKGVDGGLRKACLESGISVVAITYRLSKDAIAPAQFHDAARAIQFIRHNAKTWNMDPDRIAATGGSAGAGLSLWLGFHDDLADSDHQDPVLRQSTRLSCMVVFNGQTSYDPRFIRELFPGTDTYQHSALAQLFDVDLDQLDQATPEKQRLFEEVSALPHLTKDDVPALLVYSSKMDTKITNQSIGIHHPRFGTALKKQMDALGIECDVKTGTRLNTDEGVRTTMAFIRRHLRLEKKTSAVGR